MINSEIIKFVYMVITYDVKGLYCLSHNLHFFLLSKVVEKVSRAPRSMFTSLPTSTSSTRLPQSLRFPKTKVLASSSLHFLRGRKASRRFVRAVSSFTRYLICQGPGVPLICFSFSPPTLLPRLSLSTAFSLLVLRQRVESQQNYVWRLFLLRTLILH